MGFNTGILILNDTISSIKNHPQEFVEGISDSIGMMGLADYVELPFGGRMFHMSHADNVGVYALGGNRTRNLFRGYGDNLSNLELMKLMADEMGYRLVKKSTKKTSNET